MTLPKPKMAKWDESAITEKMCFSMINSYCFLSIMRNKIVMMNFEFCNIGSI